MKELMMASQNTTCGVIVATRNRPEALVKMLESLEGSRQRPYQVVVVSSGERIEASIARFFSSFKFLTHHHTEEKGQVRQKKIGVELLRHEVQEVLFLDDDVLLDSNALGALANYLEEDPTCVGVGTRIGNLNVNFALSDNQHRAGRLLKSGLPLEYQNCRTLREVDWLNGASMWRIEAVKLYDNNIPDMHYALFEDVYFSLIARKLGKLRYLPSAVVYVQDISKPSPTREFTVLRLRILANANLVLQFHFSWSTFILLGFLHYVVVWAKLPNKGFKLLFKGFITILVTFINLIIRTPRDKKLRGYIKQSLEYPRE